MNINITIRGTNALLLHKYTTATVSGPKARVIKSREATMYDDEWIKSTYLNKEGHVVMPSLNIIACLFDGSKGMKIGKKAITRILYTSLFVTPFEPVVMGDEKPITINDIRKNDWLDRRGAVISGRRIDRTRTMLPLGWTLSFVISTKDSSLSKEDIKAVLENAGTSAGLGDWRPSSPKKPGPYGTFAVVSFEEVK